MAIRECDYETCRGNNGGTCIAPVLTYGGRVLETYERNGYDDSDFCALVWDDETATVRTVTYASTRGWTYHNGATVDATPDVIMASRHWAAERWQAEMIRREESARTQPTKGREVRSLTTRGKNVGVMGVVMWHGPDQYRSSKWQTLYRVGIKVSGEEKLRYLDASRVKVVNPDPIDVAAIAQFAQGAAYERSFRSATECGIVSALM